MPWGRWGRWVLAASLALNLAGGAYAVYRLTREHPARPAPHQLNRRQLFEVLTVPARIVMLGDSLTDHGEWDELLGVERVANRGIGGDTIRGVTGRVRALAALDPDVIAVMVGINDLLAGRAVDACAREHEALLAALRQAAPRARIAVQSVLPVRPPAQLEPAVIAALNQRLRAMCERGGCTFVDVGAAVTDGDGLLQAELTVDGVHLTGEGYLRWRDVLRPILVGP